MDIREPVYGWVCVPSEPPSGPLKDSDLFVLHRDPYADPYYDYEMEALWRGGQYENFRVQYTEGPLPYHFTVSTPPERLRPPASVYCRTPEQKPSGFVFYIVSSWSLRNSWFMWLNFIFWPFVKFNIETKTWGCSRPSSVTWSEAETFTAPCRRGSESGSFVSATETASANGTTARGSGASGSGRGNESGSARRRGWGGRRSGRGTAWSGTRRRGRRSVLLETSGRRRRRRRWSLAPLSACLQSKQHFIFLLPLCHTYI